MIRVANEGRSLERNPERKAKGEKKDERVSL